VLEVTSDARPTRFLAVSDEACRLFGATREEILAIPPANLRLAPLDDCDVQSDLLAGENIRLVTSLAGHDSRPFEVEVVARLSQLDGRVCLIASARDAAPRPSIVLEMSDRQEQLARSEQVACVGTAKWDLVAHRTVWSDGFYRLLGLTPAGISADFETFLDRVHPDDRDLVRRSIDTVVASGGSADHDARVVYPDGTLRTLRCRSTVELGDDAAARSLYLTAQDVTEERLAADALRKSEEGLAAAQRLARIGSVDWNLEAGAGSWSDEFYRILGLEPGEIEPSLAAYLQFVHADDRRFVLDGLEEMHRTGKGRTVDVRIVARDGRDKIITATTDLLCDDDGRPTRQFSTIQDVTEIKRLQERLRLGEAFLLKAQEIANLGSWVVDLSTGHTTWSDELYRICGIAPEAWDGRVESFLTDICHPQDVGVAAETWAAMVETLDVQAGEYRIVRPEGEARVLATRGEAVRDDTGKPTRVVGVSWDITEIRAGEEALRRSEQRFELAAQGSSDGLWDWPDLGGDRFWVSPRYAELLGYPQKAFPESRLAALEMVHPDDLAGLSESLAAHIRSDDPFDVEIRMRRRDGEYRWFRLRGSSQRDGAGHATRMSGSLLDVDDRKRADEKLALYREQLRWLAEGISKASERERRRIGAELHDRTIQSLGFMRVRLGELRAALDDGRPSPALIDEIVRLADGAIRETRSLLQELSPPVLYELGFEPAVEWLAERAEQLYGFKCKAACRGASANLDDDTEVVLFQAVRELLANVGRHARASKVEVSVQREDDQLVVRVSDDGIGFAGAAIEARPTEAGGFGLFSIGERMLVLGGVMEIHSEEGKGSCIVLRLQLDDADACMTA